MGILNRKQNDGFPEIKKFEAQRDALRPRELPVKELSSIGHIVLDVIPKDSLGAPDRSARQPMPTDIASRRIDESTALIDVALEVGEQPARLPSDNQAS